MENELTTSFPAFQAMIVVPASVYTNMAALIVTSTPKKVAQDSLPSHRNSHR